MPLIQPLADGIEGMHLQAFGKARFVADESPQTRAQRVRERLGKRGQQNSAVRIGAREKHGPMQRPIAKLMHGLIR